MQTSSYMGLIPTPYDKATTIATATNGQTAFTGLKYIPNYLEVYVDGVRRFDFTAIDGTNVVFNQGLNGGQVVAFIRLAKGADRVATAAMTAYDNTGTSLTSSDLQNATSELASRSLISGFKNYIINGNFDIWQRGTTQTTNGYGSADRWRSGNVGSTKLLSRMACSDTEKALFNATFFSRMVVTSVAGTSNQVTLYQPIENVTRLAGKTVTLSFWAKADSSKNIAIELDQGFGYGGSPSTSITGIGSQLIALTSTWKKFKVTIQVPSSVGKTLGTDGVNTSCTGMNFWFDAGSSFNSRSASLGQQSGIFDIAQVQLEEGSVATSFEMRPYGLELSLCQRYYEVVHAQAVQGQSGIYDANGILVYFDYKVTKRALPTITNLNPSNTLSIHRSVTGGIAGKCITPELFHSVISADAEI